MVSISTNRTIYRATALHGFITLKPVKEFNPKKLEELTVQDGDWIQACDNEILHAASFDDDISEAVQRARQSGL